MLPHNCINGKLFCLLHGAWRLIYLRNLSLHRIHTSANDPNEKREEHQPSNDDKTDEEKGCQPPHSTTIAATVGCKVRQGRSCTKLKHGLHENAVDGCLIQLLLVNDL